MRAQRTREGDRGAAASSSRAALERDALLRVAAAAAGATDLESVLQLAAEEALQAIGRHR